MRLLPWLAELGFVVMLAGVGLCPAALPIPLLAILGTATALSLVVPTRAARTIWLLASLLLVGGLQRYPIQSLAGVIWIGGAAGLLGLFGLVQALSDLRQRRRWSRHRVEIGLAFVAACLVGSAAALLARGMLLYRSSLPLIPGELDFVALLPLWGALWLGLDAMFLKELETPPRAGSGWLWTARHPLGLLFVIGVRLLRLPFA